MPVVMTLATVEPEMVPMRLEPSDRHLRRPAAPVPHHPKRHVGQYIGAAADLKGGAKRE